MEIRRYRLSVDGLEDRTVPASVAELQASVAASAALIERFADFDWMANPVFGNWVDAFTSEAYQTGNLLAGTSVPLAGVAQSNMAFAQAISGWLGFSVLPEPPAPPGLAVGNLSLSTWNAGVPGFTGTMTVSGGKGPYSILGTASGLPTGMTASLTGNLISFAGTPTAAGTFNGNIIVRDSDGGLVPKSFTITITGPSVANLTQTTWAVNQPGFSGTMAITGGTAPYTISGTPTGVPTGLTASLSGSSISFTGTPTATGTFNGSIVVQDNLGAKVTKTFTINITGPTVGNLTAGVWTVDQPGFTGTMAVSGGTGPYTISGTPTGVPTGLTATLAGGTISFTGTPTATGTFNGSIVVQDSTGFEVTKAFTIIITVDDAGMVNTMPAANAPEWVALGTQGLKTWDVTVGTGTPVTTGAPITIFYTGWLASSGSQFDSRRSPSPAITFDLDGLIAGWKQGIPGMQDGGIRRLYIPAALGYGASGSGNIPPNANLIFEIKMVAHST